MSHTPDDTSAALMTEPSAADGLEARIAEILGDSTVSPAEKRAMLERLRDEAGEAGSDEEAYAPIETQLRHALSLLADGGHDYAGAPSPTEERPGDLDPRGEADRG